MRAEPKLRPSMTVRELKLISECVDFRIQDLVIKGQTHNPIVLDLLKLKSYCDSMQPKSVSTEALLAQYMQNSMTELKEANVQMNMETANKTYKALSTEIISLAAVSPLDNPDLTDDQRFDLLALRDETQRTEEENKWYLNVGTFIRLARASKQPVDTNDL